MKTFRYNNFSSLWRSGLTALVAMVCLPVAAQDAAAEEGADETELRQQHGGKAARHARAAHAKVLAASLADRGMNPALAFQYAYVAVLAEEQGKGRAEEVLARLVKEASPAALIAMLNESEFAELLCTLDEQGIHERSAASPTVWEALLKRLATLLENDNAPHFGAAGSGGGSGGRVASHWAQSAQAYRGGNTMPSVWWLENYSGSILQREHAMPMHMPPGAPAGNLHRRKPDKKKEGQQIATTALDDEDGRRVMSLSAAASAQSLSSAPAMASAGGGAGGGSMAPARLDGAADTPAPVDVDEAPGGNVVWDGKVANLKDGVSETFNKYQTSPVLDVTLSSVWRPWELTVDDTGITMSTHSPTGQAKPLGAVGYAFNGTGSIGDYVDEDGTVHKTTLTKKGNGILVLANVGNTYSGGTDVQGGTLYVADQGALGTGTVTMHENTSMWVNYTWNRDYTSSFRNPVVSNGINLANGASATVSYGAFPYQQVLGNDTSRIWRNLYMTGGLSGDAGSALFLQGYTSHGSSSKVDFNVDRIHLGDALKMRGELWYSGFILNRSEALTKDDRFEGTLTLGNRTNISTASADYLTSRETGAVKLVLSDDVLEYATLDATREWAWIADKPDATITAQNKLMLEGKIGDKTVEGYTVSVSDAVKNAYAEGSSLHQTNSHTILISDNTKVGELKADLLGVTQDTYRDFANWSEGLEVQYVRVATMEDNATLTLGKEKSSASSWFSGTVGFKDLLCDANGDGKDDLTEANMTGLKLAGSGATKEGLNLVKVGDNAQYIHSAKLHNLVVDGGTLGFNKVDLAGNLQLRSGTKLRVGVNDDHWTTAADTSLDIGVWGGNNNHRLTVITEDAVNMKSPITGETKPVPTAARIEGQLMLHAGTELEFVVENLGQDTGDRKVIIPVSIDGDTELSASEERIEGLNYLKEHSLLQVAGTTGVKDAAGKAADVQGVLTLSQDIAVSLTGVNFLRENYNGRTYFLAAADKIIVDGKSEAEGHAADFASRIVTLGYGFYGIISSIDGHGYYENDTYKEYTGSSYLGQDFLTLKVAADPTRSWTGSTVARGQQGGADKEGNMITPWLGTANTWKALPDIKDYTKYFDSDYKDLTDAQWKENGVYTDGVSVKFGNLYMPEEWEKFKAANPGKSVADFTEHLTSYDVTKIGAGEKIFSPNGHGNGIAMRNETGDILYGKDGSAYFNEDGTKFVTKDGLSAHYEHVMIDGTVRPGYVTVNSDYTLKEGSGYVTMKDDTNYVFTDYVAEDGTVRKGCIADATAADMEGIYKGLLGKDLDAGVMSDLADWHTGLAKGGTGALIIETENTYSGGSLLRGGLTVMRNKWALGMADPTLSKTDADAKGGRIEMAYGAALMVDYIDSYYNAADVIAQGQVTNDLVITHMADYDNTKATGDAQLMNRFDAALVVNTLSSYDDAILTLRGASLQEGTNRKADSKGQMHDFYSYADYVITNPVNAYGTIRMAGYLQGGAGRILTDDGSAYQYGGGNVQLTISGHDAKEANPKVLWDHTTIDLSLNGGNKNVLAIETRFLHKADGTVTENDGTHTINLTLGTLKDDGKSGANACVINDASSERIGSKAKTSYLAVLTLNPAADATFSGNVGFGIGQNAEGAAMPSRGYISLVKTGAATQSIGNARLLNLTVQDSGLMHVNKALSVSSITTTDTGAQHIHVGAVEDAAMSHTLTVGKGGVLSFDTTLNAADPLAGLKGTESMDKYGSELSYVLLKDGATVTGSGNWYTQKGIAAVGGANITFNTHDYSMDPTVSSTMDIYGESAQSLKDAFTDSHIFWMTQSIAGADVTLNLVNEQMSVGATETERGTATANGYVITRDLNSYVSSKNKELFFGLQGNSTVNIGAKTILQSYMSATANSGIVYNITGTDAALQFLDADSDKLKLSSSTYGSTLGETSYVDKATLSEGGRIILGGAAAATTKTTQNTDLVKTDITADADVVITNKAGQTASVQNMRTDTVDANGYETTLSAADSGRATVQHAEMTVKKMTVKKETDVNNTRVQKTDIRDTKLSLQDKCSVTLEDVVVSADSKVEGAGPASGTAGAAAVFQGATAASDQDVTAKLPSDLKKGSVTLTNDATRINTTLTNVQNVVKNDVLIQVTKADQLSRTDVGGKGLTLGLTQETLEKATAAGARYLAIQVSGSGRFLYEKEAVLESIRLTDHNGATYVNPAYDYKVVSSKDVADFIGVDESEISDTLLYIEVSETPEPTTTALSLLALAALMARRKRA